MIKLLNTLFFFILFTIFLFVLSLQKANAGEWTAFIEVGIEYTSRPNSEWLKGEDPIFNGRVGFEHSSGFSIYYRHECSLFDGPPFNDLPDQRWQDSIGITYRIEWK
jgi:hypothetical protein